MTQCLPKRKPGIYVAWRTVTYRSVALMIMGGLLIFAAAMHFAFPQFTDAQAHAVSNFAGTVLEQGRWDGARREVDRVSRSAGPLHGA